MLRAPQLRLGLEEPAGLELQLGQVEADRDLQPGIPGRPLRPRQRLAIGRVGGRVAPQLCIELTLPVQHLRHCVRRADRLDQCPGAPQVDVRRGEVSLLAREHGQAPLQPAHAPGVARPLREAEPAPVPCLRPGPFTLGERRIS